MTPSREETSGRAATQGSVAGVAGFSMKASVAEMAEVIGRARPVIEGISPVVDGGRYPAKRVVGDEIVVEADIFADGHDALAADLRYRHGTDGAFSSVAMTPLGNDRWRGSFRAERIGTAEFSIRATIDRFQSWRDDLAKRLRSGEDARAELLTGAELLCAPLPGASKDEAQLLKATAARLRELARDEAAPLEAELGSIDLDTPMLVLRHAAGPTPGSSSSVYRVEIDREQAQFSSWYELFPRSASPDPARPGTLGDVRDRLGYVAKLGFDVLYLPPIHPIGLTGRKGADGRHSAHPDDPGSPWAIGSKDGGHTAIHPDLGSFEDFDALVVSAGELGIEIALDLAFQCSPDHPWVTEHPEWFRHRPDGTIRYAENPPKHYEDIYPLDFDTVAWKELWGELRSVVVFWIERGIRVFRVDNPHTKPLRFWEWLISSIKADYPETLFLAEAFTRPRVMEHLAKVGFSQSVTYFTWRNAKWELESYLSELTTGDVVEYLRPNFWPNTPDILHETLQHGGRATFIARLVLAATLVSSYGIYGPVFELMEHEAREPGSEEYLASEKFAVRHFDLDAPGSLAGLIGRVNEIRRSSACLRQNRTLRFQRVDNDQLIAYTKTAPGRRVGNGQAEPGEPVSDEDRQAPLLVVVNLDPLHPQAGWVDLDCGLLGIDETRPYEVHDLLTDAVYTWQGRANFVRLDPAIVPAHIFRIRQDRLQVSPQPPQGFEGGGLAPKTPDEQESVAR